ncbi:hypothetical protein ES702_03382 [subsurface metagenome]
MRVFVKCHTIGENETEKGKKNIVNEGFIDAYFGYLSGQNVTYQIGTNVYLFNIE